MPNFNATASDLSKVLSIFRGQTDNVPVTTDDWIQTYKQTLDGNNDLKSVLQSIFGGETSALDVYATQPDAANYPLGKLIYVDGGFFYRVTAVSSATDGEFVADTSGSERGFARGEPGVVGGYLGRAVSNPSDRIWFVVGDGQDTNPNSPNHQIFFGIDQAVYEAIIGRAATADDLVTVTIASVSDSSITEDVTLSFHSNLHYFAANLIPHEGRITYFTSAADPGQSIMDRLPADGKFTVVVYNGAATSDPRLFTGTAGAKVWTEVSGEIFAAMHDRLADLEAEIEQGRFQEFSTLPAASQYEVGDVILAEADWYELGVADETIPNQFEAVVGSENLALTDFSELWHGVSNSRGPNGVSSTGQWTVNPDNAIATVLASSDGRLRVAMKRSAYEAGKGSEFEATDKVAINIELSSGATDTAVLAFYSAYSRQSEGYYIWQTRNPDADFNLYSADGRGDDPVTLKITFFTVDADGNATTTPLLTHAVGVKHWLLYTTLEEANLLERVHENTQLINGLSDHVREDERDIAALALDAAFVDTMPDPDTYTGSDGVILTDYQRETIGSWTGVAWGPGVYRLDDKPANPNNAAQKRFMSFRVGTQGLLRGFSEGYAGVENNSPSDPRLVFTPDFGEVVVDPLGDGVNAFRETHNLSSQGYYFYVLSVKLWAYYDLLQRINGTDFNNTTRPHLDFEGFDVTLIRMDTGASVSSGGGILYFSPRSTNNHITMINGVPYIALEHAHETRMLDGIPDGTEVLLELKNHYGSGQQLFDSSVAKAWTRADRHSPTSGQLATELQQIRDEFTAKTHTVTINDATNEKTLGTTTELPEVSKWLTITVQANGVESKVNVPEGYVVATSFGAPSATHPAFGPVAHRSGSSSGTVNIDKLMSVIKDGTNYKAAFWGTNGGREQSPFVSKIIIEYIP